MQYVEDRLIDPDPTKIFCDEDPSRILQGWSEKPGECRQSPIAYARWNSG
jgi:hypothetical protein